MFSVYILTILGHDLVKGYGQTSSEELSICQRNRGKVKPVSLASCIGARTIATQTHGRQGSCWNGQPRYCLLVIGKKRVHDNERNLQEMGHYLGEFQVPQKELPGELSANRIILGAGRACLEVFRTYVWGNGCLWINPGLRPPVVRTGRLAGRLNSTNIGSTLKG